jgi:isoleucyl-tRNA synthetase
LLEIDRYALRMTASMQAEVLTAYERYEFHTAVNRLQIFCSEDLGAFYLDILKDRLYTTAQDSPARRAAQTALHHITHALLKLLAPILSFTVEEAWADLKGNPASETIFTELFHVIPAMPDGEILARRWSRLREIRAETTREIEAVRGRGEIGSSLAAEIDYEASGDDLALLQSLGDDLRFVMLVSRADVHTGTGALRTAVQATKHSKCARCWHHRADVGHDAGHPELCGRCVSNLFGPGETREHA